jgi:hypothetical protein
MAAAIVWGARHQLMLKRVQEKGSEHVTVFGVYLLGGQTFVVPQTPPVKGKAY